MLLLGIETSCDETAVAVLEGARRVRSSVVFSQVAQHRAFGGVVPEIASRCHVEALPPLMAEALREAGAGWGDLDGIAVTRGPGLPTALVIGVTGARSLGLALDRPVYAVHHHEGHLHSLFLAPGAPAVAESCPLLALMVSGGHTMLIRMEGVGRHRVLGQTLDDAAGEALDKGATLLRLGYPGGPEIEKAAAGGDPARVPFPRGLARGGAARAFSFSFSGLKTSLLYHVRKHPGLFDDGSFASVCASYQEAVFDTLLDRLSRALDAFPDTRTLACVGGVARNARLRGRLEAMARAAGRPLLLAPLAYCTDNAAMIAAAAAAHLEAGLPLSAPADIDPVWELP